MSTEDYRKACRMGKRDYQMRLLRGERPTLEVLDSILPSNAGLSIVPLGLVQIPIDQIAGTRYEGRSSAFAGNFMPILDEKTEFARKWANLSSAHENEGIRDPIKAYEYMNKFYVEEGNKRVSVMKYYEAISIPGNVTRIMPKRTEEKENKIYYEFVDFYNLSKINYIWFSKEGNFLKLQKAVGKKPDEAWTDDERINFSSTYSRFTAAFEANGGKKLKITPGDAFLSFITLYGYRNLSEKTTIEIKNLVVKSWEEFKLIENEEEIDLQMNPPEEKKPLLGRILPTGSSKNTKLKIAFIYEKTASSSAWTYAHELGRLHLNQTFPDEITTVCYDNISANVIEECLEAAIANGCNLIFTTTPVFAPASVKAAIAHPNVRILNCSLNTSHRYIRTYYPRMHEAKFLMGAIAGAMAENDRVMYMEDYPLFGSIANINAFALGARMINPRVQVFLEWPSKKGIDLDDDFRLVRPSCISTRDMVIPESESRYFGLYHMADDRPHSIAMPLCHWGKFYEQLIRTIINGSWKQDSPSNKAINYWWGISSGVVDVICSKSLPIGTKRLVELLRHTICSGSFNPFSGTIHAQTGIVRGNPDGTLSPEEIVKMDWLAENVIGEIPTPEQLRDHATPVLSQQGVQTLNP